jgi:hypothetical protein
MSKIKIGETLRRSVRVDNSEDTAAEYDISAVANIEGASIITLVEGEVKNGNATLARWSRYRPETLTIRYDVAEGRDVILKAIEAFCVNAQAAVSA